MLVGMVKDGNGAPVVGASMQVSSSTAFGFWSSTTDANGHYSISSVTPGSVRISVQPPFGANLAPLNATVTVATGPAATTQDVVLSAPAKIRATVSTTSGAA